jgi:hypothetical protein
METIKPFLIRLFQIAYILWLGGTLYMLGFENPYGHFVDLALGSGGSLIGIMLFQYFVFGRIGFANQQE